MKTMTVIVAGKEVTLNFGVNWFIKYLYDLTGIDILKSQTIDLSADKMYEGIAGFAAAGYFAQCSLGKSERQLDAGHFTDWVMAMSPVEASDLFRQMSQCFTGNQTASDDKGEAAAQG